MSANTVYTTPAGHVLVGDAVMYAYIKSLTVRVVEAINKMDAGFTVESLDESVGEYIKIVNDDPIGLEFYIGNPVEEPGSAWTWTCFNHDAERGEMGTDIPAYDADPQVIAEWFVKTVRDAA